MVVTFLCLCFVNDSFPMVSNVISWFQCLFSYCLQCNILIWIPLYRQELQFFPSSNLIEFSSHLLHISISFFNLIYMFFFILPSTLPPSLSLKALLKIWLFSYMFWETKHAHVLLSLLEICLILYLLLTFSIVCCINF